MTDADITQTTTVLPWNWSTYRRLIDLESITTVVVVILTILLTYLQYPTQFFTTWFNMINLMPLFIVLPQLYHIRNLLTALQSPNTPPSHSTRQRYGITATTHPFRVHQILRSNLIIQALILTVFPTFFIAQLLGFQGSNPTVLLAFSIGLILAYITYRRYPHPPTPTPLIQDT